MIHRKLIAIIQDRLFQGKAIIIYGPRQAGKTTMLNIFHEKYREETVFFNCDETESKELLSNKSASTLKMFIGSKKMILIDEAQRVKNIGLTLKILTDSLPDKQIIVTGSSSFELSNEINEPLTGRKYEFYLYPLSMGEIVKDDDLLEMNRQLEYRILYGMYPEIVIKHERAYELLKNLTSSYLYKDIFEWQKIKKPELLDKLLRAVALQTGNEVSYNELSNMLEVHKETITSYLQLLEKGFIIYRLNSFSRNLRSELLKKNKFYFWDTGIRNALINNFNPLDMRPDKGALWENFLLSERMKKNQFDFNYCNTYFWRTHQQQEIDYIEEKDGRLYAYEFKWKDNKKTRAPKLFSATYPDNEFHLISKENYFKFIL